MNKLLSFFLALALTAFCAFGQTSVSSTTLSAAVTATDDSVYLTSASGVTAETISTNTMLYMDREAMRVRSVSGTQVFVYRGTDGSRLSTHASGTKVWVGPPAAFSLSRPVGDCTATLQQFLPRIVISTGETFTCPTAGANSGLWVQVTPQYSVQGTDGVFHVPPSACYTTVSGNSTGTNGYTVSGASSTPVVQAQTSATGTNTHTYICAIDVPTRLTAGKGIEITDATFLYGVQTSNLGTQAATLASGTMNSSIVFSYVLFPTPAASETASTVTPVRLDSGSLVITPAVASANVATTTAGAFYSVKFTPSAPLALNTDLRRVLLTVTLQCAATSATVTNSPGLLVHYNTVPQ